MDSTAKFSILLWTQISTAKFSILKWLENKTYFTFITRYLCSCRFCDITNAPGCFQNIISY